MSTKRKKQASAQSSTAMDRRQFLGWLAGTGTLLAGGVSASLLESIFRSGSQAHAASGSPLSLKHYILLHLHGAPPRWYWDQPLKLSATDPFVANPMTYNRIMSFDAITRRPTLAHDFREQGVGETFLLPHLWSQTIRLSEGTSVPMSRLLENWLTVRTGGTGVDGHLVNTMMNLGGSGGGTTITGLIADSTRLPIPAIQMDPLRAVPFRSKGGLSPFAINAFDLDPSQPNAAQTLLAGFDHTVGQVRSPVRNNPPVWNAVTAALRAFQDAEGAARPALRGLLSNHSKREAMISSRAYDFSGQFVSLKTKYQTLIDLNLRGRDLDGITSQAIPGLPPGPFTVDGTRTVPMEPTFNHRRITNYYVGVGSDDLRSILDTLVFPTLANEFAIAELAVRNGLGASIVISPASFFNLTLPRAIPETAVKVDPDSPAGQTRFIYSTDPADAPVDKPNFVGFIDAHDSGSLLSTLIFSVYFRALSACLHSLIEALKNTNGTDLFKDTLIHISCEFNRSPRNNLTGGDHGFYGATQSFLSGRIEGSRFVGDIRVAARAASIPSIYPGTWGEGAVHAQLGGQRIGPGNILSSIASLFGVESPTTNSAAIFGLSAAGKIITSLPRGRTVSEA